MFDNLREETSPDPLPEDHAKFQPAAGTTSDPATKSKRMFGMTPVQRFIVVAMLMVAVCSLGLMCLLVTGKIGLF
jgi:hypothetical protein